MDDERGELIEEEAPVIGTGSWNLRDSYWTFPRQEISTTSEYRTSSTMAGKKIELVTDHSEDYCRNYSRNLVNCIVCVVV